MTEKIHVEFCVDLNGDMDFRPCVGDLVFIWDLTDDPFVVDHIALDFPDDNDEHRNGITAWLKPQL